MNTQQWNRLPARTRKLAKAFHDTLSFGRWDTHAAGNAVEWVNRIDAANPQTPEDFAAARVNFDWMRPLARENYRKESASVKSSRTDKAFEIWAQSNAN